MHYKEQKRLLLRLLVGLLQFTLIVFTAFGAGEHLSKKLVAVYIFNQANVPSNQQYISQGDFSCGIKRFWWLRRLHSFDPLGTGLGGNSLSGY